MKTPSSAAIPDGVSGLVERVTFHNPETGFAVMRVTVKGRREPLTVVGVVASVNTGEWITAQGTWVRDREHGLQLKADSITCNAPNSREGIEKYLGSGLIKGIGPVYAKKLVDTFGEEIFAIIDQCSVRLEEIDGIGPTRRRKIKAAWAEQKVVREIMVFLHSHGVTTSRALRIYKTYGENAIETVRADPYTLAKDIQGIGFKSADLIAQKLGLPRDSIIRAQAGIKQALLDATNQGHCALPRGTLIEEAARLLGVDVAIVEQALERLILNAEVMPEQIGEQHLLYLPYLRRAEQGIAKLLKKLSSAPSQLPPINIEKAVTWCEQQTGKELAPTQREAIRKALENRVLVITGGPGVGKTTLVRSILLILRAKKLDCLLCAPTGRAAKRLGEVTGLEAKTIHRLLEFQPASGGFTRDANNPLECDVLVSDESSMIDLPLFHKLIQALPEHAHLLLVGDIDQLPSIGPGSVLTDIIRSNVVPVVRLTEIFRQSASSRITANAHSIRAGQMPQLQETAKESDFFFIERDEPASIQSTILELVEVRIPKKLRLDPILDVQVLSPMNRGSLGARELNMLLQERLNPCRDGEPTVERFGWQFRLRDKVIQTENDYEKEVFNGDIGQIVKIQPEERELAIRFDDREVPYDFGELDEVSLAYAITIHKSQGSEFPAVVIPLALQHYVLLQRNLVYTAITRGRQMVVLVGQKRALASAVRNDNIGQRFSALYNRLLAARSEITANGQ
ncbi:MAG TPA: ATP-dependent RecD-like DNA helicase [Chthoniobacterales bacterium]|nr:ATP-dependent RecD-like DNA helicase [Chthoniobacterales bacterium]